MHRELFITRHRIISPVGSIAVLLFLGLLLWWLFFPGAARSSAPPRIEGVEVEEVEENEAVVRWRTDKEADSMINYGLRSDYGMVREPGASRTEHELRLEDLLPGTTYYFRVVSRDAEGNQTVASDFQFTTEGELTREDLEEMEVEDPVTEVDPEATPAEMIEEILSEIDDVEEIRGIEEMIEDRTLEMVEDLTIVGDPRVETEEDRAWVRWQTNRPANSEIHFQDEDRFDPQNPNLPRSQRGPDEPTTEHEVEVTGLIPSTQYYFRAVSEDDAGIRVESDISDFETNALSPSIRNVELAAAGEDFAILEWSTSVPAESLVEYENLSTGDISSRGSPTLSTNHSLRISDLDYQQTYQARVLAIGEDGGMEESDPIEFETEINEDPPEVSNVETESTLYPGAEARVQTIISWETDQQAICKVNYQEGLASGVDTYELEPRDDTPMLDHVQVVTDFRPATVYQFWFICEDRFENEGRSDDFVVFTPQEEQNIIDIIMENFEESFGWIEDMFN